jgi:hypothetical protein
MESFKVGEQGIVSEPNPYFPEYRVVVRGQVQAGKESGME